MSIFRTPYRITPPAIHSVSEGEKFLRNWSNARMPSASEPYCEPWKGSNLADRMCVAHRLLMIRDADQQERGR